MTTPEWLEALLQDRSITDLCLNGPKEIFADRGEGLQRVPASESWTEEELRCWLVSQLALAGKSWDARHPFADATLPSGHRLHAGFPPVARAGIIVSLRRLPEPRSEPSRWRHSPFFAPLAQAAARGDSILIAGATGAGKTTLASDLLTQAPAKERIIALEDTPELAPAHPHFLSLVSRPPNADGHGEVTLRMLLKQTLRMRPDRIVLGECRGPEVLDLLQAVNTGHRGAMATLHANSARDALRRIELLCLLAAGGALPPSIVRELLACGIQWIAFVSRSGGQRCITELWRIEGREGDTILMRPMIQLEHEPQSSSDQQRACLEPLLYRGSARLPGNLVSEVQ